MPSTSVSAVQLLCLNYNRTLSSTATAPFLLLFSVSRRYGIAVRCLHQCVHAYLSNRIHLWSLRNSFPQVECTAACAQITSSGISQQEYILDDVTFRWQGELLGFLQYVLCHLRPCVEKVAGGDSAASAAAPPAAQEQVEPEPSPEEMAKMLAALQKIRSHIGQAAKREKASQLLCKLLSDGALSLHHRDATFQVLIRPRPSLTASCVLKFGHAHPPCLLYTSPSPRDLSTSRMPSSA